MSVINIFNGRFCQTEAVVSDIIESTGYGRITDADIVKATSLKTGLAESKIMRAFVAKKSVFNKFTHEKECFIAHLRMAVAEHLAEDDFIITGFCGLLIPRSISHVLHVCLVAELAYRIEQAQAAGLEKKEALKQIRTDDSDRAAWVDTLFTKSDPWDDELYDIVIPVNTMPMERVSTLIEENVFKDILRPNPESLKAAKDFHLAATVEVALCDAGHNVAVSAVDGAVRLTINKHVLMLSRLEEELKTVAEKIPGVVSVTTEVGQDYHQAHIYRKHNFEVPSKVLLVDDEREFVQTLSERLEMRDMGSAIAYDGASALDMVSCDEPEVMIIDLKMPGIDGVEVLKKVKKTRPEIEVIVLTGHGSSEDEKKCMDLGAFAYMQKPVDINKLSEALKNAHAKIQKKVKTGGTCQLKTD
jgi:two-component system, OmpR family, response regulator CpxR